MRDKTSTSKFKLQTQSAEPSCSEPETKFHMPLPLTIMLPFGLLGFRPGQLFNNIVGYFINSMFLLVARRATYVVDGRFFAHYFWKVEGTVRIHVNSRVAHVWLLYTVINLQDGGGDSELRKTRKVWKTSNFYKGGGEH